MAKRPVDYTTQMQSVEERRRLRKIQEQEEKQREEALLMRQAQSHGEVLLQVYERGLTIDVHAGLLLESQERLRANPELEEEWAARGAEFFRPAAQRKQPAETKRATGNGHSGNGYAQDGDTRHEDARHEDDPLGQSPIGPPAQPPHARAAAPRGTPDLLNGLAADQTGPGAPAEGGSHGGSE